MSFTDIIILVLTLAFFAFALYDEIIINHLKSPTLLSIPLLRRSRADGMIFVILVAILIGNNIHAQGPAFTTWLLSALALVGFYIFWIRTPRVRFKKAGFFFSGFWTPYSKITAMNLSEDGVLVFQLGERRLLICVRNIDDLEKIYKFMVNNQ
ncbi:MULTISPECIES: DUF986 family protein [Mangrovibacter]|uniref:UPF0266 membrane protein DES37_10864 n=1 Tax=Mangrovibacter plantisponsor TaxID=451513 RepID=A0A317PWV4_9ENTR|nr:MULTISPECIES: DUF986 family protein [Mangrovibacter]KEA52945.1 hypothetical protein DT73_09405 [Mangrovibacter sp. MFB070]PWW07641.1 uncharacterized membrane protein YobD (UPF0266 family) [Mangrovibacter plantisponsor]